MKLFIVFFSLCVLCSCSKKSDNQNEKRASIPDTTVVKPAEKDRYAELKALDGRVHIEEIPPTNVLLLRFTGNYQRHPEAYGKLYAYAAARYRIVGGVLGLYPQDPDLVEESKLSWEISLRVLPGKQEKTTVPSKEDPFFIQATDEELGTSLKDLTKPDAPFELRQLPSAHTVTLVSDVAHIGMDGLLINAWITMNNYVQTGTARTEFGSPSEKSQIIPVKIMVPVKKRSVETIH